MRLALLALPFAAPFVVIACVGDDRSCRECDVVRVRELRA
jgi:hypothetical protein